MRSIAIRFGTRLFVVVLGAALLAGCHQRQPKITDPQMARLRAEMPGMTDACLDKVKWGGIEAMPPETDKCFKMLPAMHWRGLWRDQFEGQLFCPSPATRCPALSQREWTDIHYESRPAGVEKDPLGAVYSVDFIGRRTAQGTPMRAYGYQQEMIVDRWISAREVQPAPPPPTKAEMDAWCQKTHQCISGIELNQMSR